MNITITDFKNTAMYAKFNVKDDVKQQALYAQKVRKQFFKYQQLRISAIAEISSATSNIEAAKLNIDAIKLKNQFSVNDIADIEEYRSLVLTGTENEVELDEVLKLLTNKLKLAELNLKILDEGAEKLFGAPTAVADVPAVEAN